MFTSCDMRQAATGTMSLRVISLFRCGSYCGRRFTNARRTSSLGLFRYRHFIRDPAGKVGVVSEGEK